MSGQRPHTQRGPARPGRCLHLGGAAEELLWEQRSRHCSLSAGPLGSTVSPRLGVKAPGLEMGGEDGAMGAEEGDSHPLPTAVTSFCFNNHQAPFK